MKILYIDLDNVLVDFQTGIDSLDEKMKTEYEGRYDETPGIFSQMAPKTGAIEAVKALSPKYDIYILSTAPLEQSQRMVGQIKLGKAVFG